MRLNIFYMLKYTLFFKKTLLTFILTAYENPVCLLATWSSSLVSEVYDKVFYPFFSVICRGFFIYSGYYSFMSCAAKSFPSVWLVFSHCSWYINILVCSNISIFFLWLACHISFKKIYSLGMNMVDTLFFNAL